VTEEHEPGVELYWLPLGAGGHSVRLNGGVFEAVAARLGAGEMWDSNSTIAWVLARAGLRPE
jgi:hypothetical protein